MVYTPRIKVKLVHLKGPMEGEIQEFEDSQIFIGRHPDAHVPLKLDIISRNHAEIVREGTRFKFIDNGVNPTLVDGKEIPAIHVDGKIIREIYLRSGNVLTLADQQGPKISFLTETIDDGFIEQPIPRAPQTPAAQEVRPNPIPRAPQTPAAQEVRPNPILRAPQTPAAQEVRPKDENRLTSLSQKKKIEISVQYGMEIDNYELPVIIGRSPGCRQCVINHPELMDQHLKVSYLQEQYIIEDLSGKSQISIDGQFIQSQGVIQAGQVLSLTPKGPKFDFLNGRLMEKPEEIVIDEIAEPPKTDNRRTEEPKKGKFLWPFGKK